jgi:flagellar protein FlbD
MIVLHRLNGKEFVLNCELIQYIESSPDTLITLLNREKLMVQESVTQVMNAALQYKQGIYKQDQLTARPKDIP